MTFDENQHGTADQPVREVTRHLYGCVRQNHVRDVLDVLDALDLDFMPVVDDFQNGRVVGVMTRSHMEEALDRIGADVRVSHVDPVTLPTLADHTPVGDVPDLLEDAGPYVVIQPEGERLVGIYEPNGRGALP